MTRSCAPLALHLRATCALLLAMPFAAACSQPPAAARAADPAPLCIVQVDVGQADAALITTPEGRRILIDAGRDYGAVMRVLRSERIDTIDLVIASHAHADHIGGMVNLLRETVVRAYVDNGVPHTTATYRATLSAIEREPGVQYLNATERTITVGSVRVRVLALPLGNAGHNNSSVGVIIEHGEFRALYTGDSELGEISAWLAAGKIPKVTVVKVAHHGSWNGTSRDLVRATSPKAVLISVSSSNTYGHPAPSVVQMWQASGAAIYRTDRDGDIEISAKIDGSFTVRTARTPAAARGRQ